MGQTTDEWIQQLSAVTEQGCKISLKGLKPGDQPRKMRAIVVLYDLHGLQPGGRPTKALAMGGVHLALFQKQTVVNMEELIPDREDQDGFSKLGLGSLSIQGPVHMINELRNKAVTVELCDFGGQYDLHGLQPGGRPTSTLVTGGVHLAQFQQQTVVNMEELIPDREDQDGFSKLGLGSLSIQGPVHMINELRNKAVTVELCDFGGQYDLHGLQPGGRPTSTLVTGGVHPAQFHQQTVVNMEELIPDREDQDGFSKLGLGSLSIQGPVHMINELRNKAVTVELCDFGGQYDLHGLQPGGRPTNALVTGGVHPAQFQQQTVVNMEELIPYREDQDDLSQLGLGSLSIQGSVGLQVGFSDPTNNQIPLPQHNTGKGRLADILDLTLGPKQSNPFWRLILLAAFTLVIAALIGILRLPENLHGVHETYRRVMLIATVGVPIVVATITLLASFWLASNADRRGNWITALSVANVSMLGGPLAVYWVLTRETGN